MTGALTVSGLLVAVAAAARGTWSPCGLSMVSAINPLSERSRGNRYWLTALWFVFGAVLGGAALGAGAALIAFVLPWFGIASLLLGATGCLIALAADRRLYGFSLPLHPRQVNELWLMRYRRWVYAAGFGVQIGAGFTTYIMTAATYLVLVLAGLSASPVAAFGTGLLFGLVRGAAVLLSARCRSAGALRQLHLRLSQAERGSLYAVMAVETAVGIGLSYAAAPWLGAMAAVLAVAVLGLSAGRTPVARIFRRGVPVGSVAVAVPPDELTGPGAIGNELTRSS